jgi:hypothetical protein
MQTKTIVIFLFMIIVVSCTTKQKYELSDISAPLLDEWFADFKAADSSFSAEKFTPTYFSEKTEKTEKTKEFSKDWYDCEPYFEKWFIFSPDSSFYLDLDFYTCLDCVSEDGVWTGGEPDEKVILVDVRNKKAIDIIPANSSDGAIDAFWVNDSVFVMLGSDYDYQNEEAYPYIAKWNREKIIVVYLYDGTINNLFDENFSPFFKRLQRLGIKIAGELGM